ncbi:hypothetical protein DENSPDRAFT_887322 [Dentipellis sp. KUC8613]|nr:hypothetical protein DENSPDRAFT_887322 [Dentipellis sp. KUC8613]
MSRHRHPLSHAPPQHYPRALGRAKSKHSAVALFAQPSCSHHVAPSSCCDVVAPFSCPSAAHRARAPPSPRLAPSRLCRPSCGHALLAPLAPSRCRRPDTPSSTPRRPVITPSHAFVAPPSWPSTCALLTLRSHRSRSFAPLAPRPARRPPPCAQHSP